MKLNVKEIKKLGRLGKRRIGREKWEASRREIKWGSSRERKWGTAHPESIAAWPFKLANRFCAPTTPDFLSVCHLAHNRRDTFLLINFFHWSMRVRGHLFYPSSQGFI